MSINGFQIIYRLESTIRIFIDYREGVDLFKLTYCNTETGTFEDLATIANVASRVPASRGKVIFEFNPTTLVNWDNKTRNYIKMQLIVDGAIVSEEGPTIIFPRLEEKVPKEFSVIYGLNEELQKFIPISVDETGKIKTV